MPDVISAASNAAGPSTIKENPALLLIGTFISKSHFNHSVGEDLAERLRGRGWDVHLTSRRGSKLGRLLDTTIAPWQLRQEYDVAQVDVYSGNAFVWAETACWTLRQAGKPYALVLRGGNLPIFASRWPNRVGRLLNSAHTVLTPSRYLHEEMRGFAQNLKLLPNPVDLSSFRFKLRTKAEPKLVWLRAFHKVYNPTLAPEVLKHVSTDHPEATLLMLGPDKDGSFSKTKAVAERLGIGDRTEFPGGIPRPQVPTQLHRGDIFLNTTNFDNTPVSVLEAMGCGLCVVSTNVGGIPYLLEHEKDALLVPPGQADKMADAVRRILTEPGFAEKLSRNARRKAEQFAWDAVLPKWENILLDLGEHANG